METFGELEGDTCWRNGCQGIIAERPVENCSCHINPPCGACTTPREYCQSCDWTAKDEERSWSINDSVVKYIDAEKSIVKSFEPRPLDPRKIDWHSKSHSNSSMIKEGVYPDGTTQSDVLAQVKGTFGGRFEHFGNGRFKYIAYTD